MGCPEDRLVRYEMGTGWHRDGLGEGRVVMYLVFSGFEARADILQKKYGLIPVFVDEVVALWQNMYHHQQTFTMIANNVYTEFDRNIYPQTMH